MSNEHPKYAFPGADPWEEVDAGMSLRDYFAAKAMQGALSGCAARGEVVDYKDLAGFSYDIADAMIAEREK